MSFSQATAVARASESAFSAEIQPGWDIFGIANGGYLMAITARAMGELAPGRELVSISSHFLAPGRPGGVIVDVEPLKVGRGISTLRAQMRTDSRLLVTTIASFADPARPISEATLIDSEPPEVPAPEQCVKAVPSSDGPFPPPFTDKVDLMIHPDDVPEFNPQRPGLARIRGWFRLTDGEQADPPAVVMAADSFPPAIFNTDLPRNWTPTLDMTTHVRNSRPAGWLRMEFRTKFVTGGLLEEDGEIWDEEGNLVAHSRQLALVPS